MATRTSSGWTASRSSRTPSTATGSSVAMTATHTSVAPTAAEPATVRRFGATERALHWINAIGFLGLGATGLALFLPSLAAAIGDRPLVKALHLLFAGGWLTGLAAVVAGGDRRALGRTRRE